MILRKIDGNLRDFPDLADYHVETAMVKSDDLAKSILRVETDHHNAYGIRLEDGDEALENGSLFKINSHNLLVLRVIPEEMIVAVPKDIDEMGILAHFLGNLHKPVQVKDGKISLLYDKIVAQALDRDGVDYSIESIQLEESLRYVDFTKSR